MKTDEFIEDRIRWRAREHGFPKQSTHFWANVKNAPQIHLPKELGKPILVSSSSEADLIVLCTRGAVVKSNGQETRFSYEDIEEIRDAPITEDEDKADLSRLVIKLSSGNEIFVSPEPYGPAFSIWNILIMLQRLHWPGET
ncbi:hypothetical protein [Hahella sp. HN01]|uniref:hypothetical protein n=1 Tax=Hahella sp. HN01 TaxID=2847262 RepID=UPI001C1F1657|nr:hypothetical protein [Hahella sp. HN01]MBU6953260.1 hypothetical protein [Hahella sp. HN01]